MTSTLVPATSFSAETDIKIDSKSEPRLAITTGGKQMVLGFPSLEAKPIIDRYNRPMLVVTQTPEVVSVLEAVRQRCIKELGIKDEEMRPILSAGKGLLNQRKSLFLSISPNAVLKDLKGAKVDFSSLVKSTCKFVGFVHVAHVYKGDDNVYSLQLKVSQLMLQSKSASIVEVEQTPVDEFDTSALGVQ